jgi:hypothetical protein
MSYADIIQKIKEGKSIEVNYDNTGIVLNEYKGISKISKEDLSEIKKIARKTKVKLNKKILELLEKIIKTLVENRIQFKVIIEKEVHVKFSLDNYLTFYEGKIKIFGFSSKEEYPLNLFFNYIKDFDYKFYKSI